MKRNAERAALGFCAAMALAGCERPPASYQMPPPVAAPVAPEPIADAKGVEALQSELVSLAERLASEMPAVEPPPPAPVEPEVADVPGPAPASDDPFAPENLPELGPWLADPDLMNDPDARYFIAVAREIATMRADLERVRIRMDEMLGTEADMLRQENADLRRELARLRGGDMGTEPGSYASPFAAEGSPGAVRVVTPADAFETAVTDAAPLAPIPSQTAPMVEPSAELTEGTDTRNENGMALVASSEASYAVIVEWGRTPEKAAAAGPDVQSLQGMICVIPSGTDEADLVGLGQQFQREYEAYDNINIQVFNDMEAAQAYAQTNSQEKGAPVLKVSRYRASGLNTVEVLRDGAYVAVE